MDTKFSAAFPNPINRRKRGRREESEHANKKDITKNDI